MPCFLARSRVRFHRTGWVLQRRLSKKLTLSVFGAAAVCPCVPCFLARSLAGMRSLLFHNPPLLARCRYTGEDGFELSIPNNKVGGWQGDSNSTRAAGWVRQLAGWQACRAEHEAPTACMLAAGSQGRESHSRVKPQPHTHTQQNPSRPKHEHPTPSGC